MRENGSLVLASPKIAIYDFPNLVKKLFFPIPLIFFIPTVSFSSAIALSDQPSVSHSEASINIPV